MENLIDIVVKIIAALLAIGGAWLIGKAKAYFAAKIEATENADLIRVIEQFCAAAEQIFKMDDPTGAKRKEYVQGLLVDLGIEVNSAIDALIEAAVYRINANAREAGTNGAE